MIHNILDDHNRENSKTYDLHSAHMLIKDGDIQDSYRPNPITTQISRVVMKIQKEEEDKEKEEEKEAEEAINFKQILDKIWNTTIKNTIELISTILSLIIVTIYVITTYFPFGNFQWFDILNYVIAIYFNLEIIINIYLAQHRIQYIFELTTLINLFTSIMPYFASIDNFILAKVVEIARTFHIFRIQRVVELLLKNMQMQNEVTLHLAHMATSFITLILIFTCIFRIVEVSVIHDFMIHPDKRIYDLLNQNAFHDFLYYIVVTIATVGYGDIFPISEYGRIVIAGLILSATFLIPMETGKLFTLLENTSIYSRHVYTALLAIPHLVVIGDVSVDGLISCCNELFHPDHGENEKNVIVLHPSSPNPDMRIFLHAGKYEVNLKYLQGDPMFEPDLEKVDICKADAIIILTDKYTEEPHSVDHKNIMLALNVKKFFLKKKKFDSRLLIQLLKPENKIHYLSGLQSLTRANKESNDQIIILEEIKMNLLSKSCNIPGIIPFIINLTSTSGSFEEQEENWLNEYLEGASMEIYRSSLNEAFKNKTFSQITKKIYELYDAIAFALEFEINGKSTIVLNPGSFYIEKAIEHRTDVNFYIYLICSDQDVADHIAQADLLKKPQNERENPIKISSSNRHLELTRESLYELEDNYYFKSTINEEDNYFIYNTITLTSNVKKDSIRNSLEYRDHIVVCGTHPSLFYFLLPLRAKYLGEENLKQVVILTEDMPKELWDSISRFKDIILINGSAFCIEDLYRANIEYASQAVILENSVKKQFSITDKMVDSERIFIYKAIKKCNPHIQLRTELNFESNIEFLLPDQELNKLKPGKVDYQSTSAYSAGEIYLSSLIDMMTSQSYYNKHIITIIRQFLIGTMQGSSPISQIFDNIGLHPSNLWQINIPDQFINKTFIELYDHFCDIDLLPLALFRLQGARDNFHPYIYTKPSKDTILTHHDKIFVLAIQNINYYFNQITDKIIDDKEDDYTKKENMKREIRLRNIASSPYAYVGEIVLEIEKQVNSINSLVNEAEANLYECIENGVRQEFQAILN